MNRWVSPIGPLDVLAGPHGVSSVIEARDVDCEPVDSSLAERLDDHVRGRPAQLRLDFQGLSPLVQVALAKVLEIPFGEVRSYGWIAREIGRVGSGKAVAAALADNPVPVLVPSHRVIRTDGLLGDYELGGTRVKETLLRFEGLDLDAFGTLVAEGVRFVGDDTLFHVLSCRRFSGGDKDGHLASVEEAHRRHLQPCRACRPI